MVGHACGDVRLYQFADTPQSVHRINLDETLLPYENIAAQVWGDGLVCWVDEDGV